jgi:riboflavin biosynthesis pyrimidine reductase
MIFPDNGPELDLLGLAGLYAYPRQDWVRANMVASADGAAYLEGKSGGLSGADDKRVFGVLRVLADVVLVGSGTARAEGYRPALRRPSLAALRAGRPETATIAVVSRSLSLDLDSSLYTETAPDARTVVLTCSAADPGLRARTARVADVVVAGDDHVDLSAALAALADRGLTRVVCEGGPHLLADVAAAGLLDELCLSYSPLLAGPGADRILAGPAQGSPVQGSPAQPARPLTLQHVLAGDGGFLLTRYVAADRPLSASPAS